jgi:hypothetical protein
MTPRQQLQQLPAEILQEHERRHAHTRTRVQDLLLQVRARRLTEPACSPRELEQRYQRMLQNLRDIQPLRAQIVPQKKRGT